ncbi:MAG: terminase, partial [Proteobacteria bacterium]|nr:terminase [Pseudomonadota bacterium]
NARPEDVDTDGEDHAADEWRYACMSRPWVRRVDMTPKLPRDGYSRPGGTSSRDAWKVAT